MKFYYIYTAILLFFKTSLLFAQDNIQNFTLSIVDTSKTQTEQVLEIYNWVTANISYDIKAFKKGESLNSSTRQIINRKKGLCSDYAILVEEMCRSIGIEAYTINGYSKGFRYIKEKPFLRSNHTWNVVYADNAWMHIDATWGSGYIDVKPRTYQKILGEIARIPYANTKLYTSKETTAKYFNIPVDSLIKTHYPLDPKWLFNNNPISLKNFQNDTINDNIDYPYFMERIEGIRNKNSIYQYIEEGIKGNEYNSLNYFDLANAHANKANDYDLERSITKDNSWQFEKYILEYNTIIDAINKHKTISDSVYRSRTKLLREVARDQKKLTGRIKSKAKKAQKAQKSSQKKIVGKNSSYKKKMNGYQINIGRTELKKVPLIVLHELEYTDTNQVELLKKDIRQLKSNQPILDKKLDSLIQVIDNYSYKDAQIDDSIATSNKVFKKNIDVLWYMILSGNESTIIDYVDSLKVVYKDIEDFLIGKKNAKSDLQNTGRAFYSYSVLLQKSLKQEMSLNTKLQKLTNNADSVIKAYNQNIEDLISCYKKSIVFTKKLANHNDLQTGVRHNNLTALKEQKRSINKENKFFVSWYENHIQLEKEEYTRNKETVKQIRSTALRSQKAVEMKVKKYKDKKAE